MNHKTLHILEEDYDNDTHVSAWLILHILAVRFCIEELAVESLHRYRSCRNPHWEGLWLPLPAEIAYIADNEEHSTRVKCVIVEYITSQCFSRRCAGDLRKIAVLLGCYEDLTLEVLRAIRDHISERDKTTQIYETDECIQNYIPTEFEDTIRPHSEAGFTEMTEIMVCTPQNAITKDDEDAMEAAEVLEAMSEVHNSGWNAVNTTN